MNRASLGCWIDVGGYAYINKAVFQLPRAPCSLMAYKSTSVEQVEALACTDVLRPARGSRIA